MQKDERISFLESMLQATKKDTIKWRKVAGQNYWETRKGKNHIIFHPNDKGCVSMGYNVNGMRGMFNIWPDDKDAVALGLEFNSLITKMEPKIKITPLSKIARLFLKE